LRAGPPVYDVVFGRVFEQAGRDLDRCRGENHCGANGGRILEVGVGTGISLQSYNRKNRLVGIDISAPMLRRAQDRVIEHRLTNVEALAVMDAKHLAVPDASFDAVVAQYVITAVPDPEATLDEFVRVLKPWRRDHSGQPSRRRVRFSLGVRAGLLADRAAARLEPGVSLGPAGALGRARRRPPDRAPADAADGAFLADPLRQGGLNVAGDGTCSPRGRYHPA
jgi:SAM-dependent methyltransferase